MRKLFLFLLLSCCGLGFAQQNEIKPQSTILVEAGDSDETVIAKAAHVVPTPNQLEALKNGFIAFVHFGPNTFTRMEWGTGKEDPKIFDLKELHTLISAHMYYTGSQLAKEMIDAWNVYSKQFIKVIPTEYKRIMAMNDF